MKHFLKKGSRVRAQWFRVTDAALAGMQPKVGATFEAFEGTVTHIRGDHPTNPTDYRIWLKVEGKDEEVVINPLHIVAVMEP